MSERKESKAVERSCRLYQRLLALYPKRHREEYGGAMSQLFRDQCRDAWSEGRKRGMINLWVRALLDLLKTSVLEHLSNLNRRKSMSKLFRPQFRPLSVFFPLFISVFLILLLGSIVVTLLTPERFRSEAKTMIASGQTDLHVGSAFPYDPYALKTEFEVIQSHAVLSNVIGALNLCEIWGKKYNGGMPLKNSDAEAVLKRNMELRPIRNTMILEINAFSDSPWEARELAEAMVRAYRQYHQEQLQRGDIDAAGKRLLIIESPAPPMMVGPDKPLIVGLGVLAGILFGLIAGALATGFVAGLKRNRSVQ